MIQIKQYDVEMCLREVPGATGAVCCSVDFFATPSGPEKKNLSQVRPTAADLDGTGWDGRSLKCQRCNNTTKKQHTDRFGAGTTTAVAGVVVWPRVGAGCITTTTNHGRIGVGDSSLYCACNSLRGCV